MGPLGKDSFSAVPKAKTEVLRSIWIFGLDFLFDKSCNTNGSDHRGRIRMCPWNDEMHAVVGTIEKLPTAGCKAGEIGCAQILTHGWPVLIGHTTCP